MDKLERIFELQKELDKKITDERKINYDFNTWVEKEILAIISELGEILNETNFKWWKNPKEINHKALKEEVVDVLHFFVSLCLKIGITPQELYEAYLTKNNENVRRQEGLSEKKGYEVRKIQSS